MASCCSLPAGPDHSHPKTYTIFRPGPPVRRRPEDPQVDTGQMADPLRMALDHATPGVGAEAIPDTLTATHTTDRSSRA